MCQSGFRCVQSVLNLDLEFGLGYVARLVVIYARLTWLPCSGSYHSTFQSNLGSKASAKETTSSGTFAVSNARDLHVWVIHTLCSPLGVSLKFWFALLLARAVSAAVDVNASPWYCDTSFQPIIKCIYIIWLTQLLCTSIYSQVWHYSSSHRNTGWNYSS